MKLCAGSCECGNEPSVSTKRAGFLNWRPVSFSRRTLLNRGNKLCICKQNDVMSQYVVKLSDVWYNFLYERLPRTSEMTSFALEGHSKNTRQWNLQCRPRCTVRTFKSSDAAGLGAPYGSKYFQGYHKFKSPSSQGGSRNLNPSASKDWFYLYEFREIGPIK
jgi:hypothetical protein